MNRRNCLLPVAILGFAALATPPAPAQTWTGAASGSWNAAGNWSPTGVPANGATTQLIFDTTANAAMTADIQATLNVFNLNQMTFTANAPAYSLTGDTLSFHLNGATPATIAMNSGNSVTIANNIDLINNLTVSGTGIGTLTLSGTISNPASVTYAGASILVLSGTNSYTGGTSVGSGSLDIPNIANGSTPSPLGDSSNAAGNLNLGTAMPSRGNLLLTGTNAAYSTDRGVTVAGLYASGGGGAIGVQNAGATLTWAGQITGAGSFIKTGAGTLSLTNTSDNFTGGAFVEAGTLSVGAAGSVLPANSTVTALTGGTFQVGAAAGDNSAAALGAVNVNGGTLQSAAGSGNYYVNQLAMTGGTVDFSASTNFGLHLSGAGAAVTINAGTSTWTGGGTSRIQNDTAGPVTVTANAGGTLNAGIILSNAGTNPNFTLTGAGSIRLSNPGNTANITANGANVFSSDLSTDVGAGAFGTLGTGSFALTNRSFLNYDGMSATSAKPLTVANGSIAVLNAGTNLTLSGVISNSDPTAFVEVLGPAFANVAGTGTVTLTANNTYGGPTFVSDGAVLAIPTIGTAGTASPLGTSSNAPANLNLGQAIQFGGRGDLMLTGTAAAYSTDRGVTINGFYGIGTGGGAIGVQNAATTLTWNGQITGPGEFIKSGAGTLVLTNTNNNWQGGTVVEAGQLVIGGANGVGILPTGSGAAILAGAQLNFAAFIDGSQAASAQSTFFVEGGTLRLSGNAVRVFLNQLWCYTGSTVDLTPTPSSPQLRLDFVNAAPLINVLGNSTWIGVNSYMLNNSGVQLPITIAPNVTLTSSVDLASGGTLPNNLYPFLVNGGGTLYLTGAGGALVDVTVTQARLRVDNFTPIQLTTLTLDNGTLQYSGPTQAATYQFSIGPGGGTLEISNAGTTLTLTDFISAVSGIVPGPFTKAGPGVLALVGANSPFFGGVVVNAGRLEISDDAELGLANVTVNQLGTLRFTANTTSARTFILNGGTLDVSSGAALTLNGATVGGGFMHGPGPVAVTGGTALVGVTTSVNAVINQTGPGSYANFTNGGALTIAAGIAGPIAFSSFTNQGSGAITVGAASLVNVADFQTYGTLTLNPAVVGSGQFTELVNTGTSPLFFNGGSRTFLGTPATAGPPAAPNFVAGIDLHGQNAVVAGGLFVNNGFVVDSTNNGQGTATIIADFGALVKGAGYYQNPIITQNGGKVQAGNSPGTASFGRFVFGPGGVSNYVFAIDDATGTAGPTPDALGHVSGWGLISAVQHSTGLVTSSGDFTWTATPAAKLTVAIGTLINPTTVGTDVAGLMADFDPTQAYTWLAAGWAGSYFGPTDTALLDAATTFDSSGFLNPVAGTFGWQLNSGNRELSLVYTPTAVPEPSALVMVAGAALAAWIRRRRPTVCGDAAETIH
jgi:fibronectin-binding autotransporter adhesin